MDIRARRRASWTFVGAGVLATAFFGGCAVRLTDQERISNYWAAARIDESGDAAITEVIDYDFGSEQRHGIFRVVPGLDPAAPIAVRSDTAPDQVSTSLRAEGAYIRIGDPNRNVGGRHAYSITYSLSTLTNGERVSWNAVGTEWEVPIEAVEVHLLTPFEVTNVLCSQGRARREGGCKAQQVEPGHLVVRNDSTLDAGVGMTISGDVGAPVAQVPTVVDEDLATSDPGAGTLIPAAASALAALVLAVPAALLVRLAGREQVWEGGSGAAVLGPDGATAVVDPSAPPVAAAIRRADAKELDDLASIDFAPPTTLTPWQGGIVWQEKVVDEHATAWLLERAVNGEIDLQGEGRALSLHVTDVPMHDPALQLMFGGRSEVDLNAYDRSFQAGWKEIKARMGDFVKASDRWDPGADVIRVLVMVGAVISAIVGALVLFFGAVKAASDGTGWVPVMMVGAALIGAAVGALAKSWELRVRTPAGSAEWVRVESFRRFLERSEAKHVDWAAEHGLLRTYTAWAVALGEVDHWNAAVRSSQNAASYDPAGMQMAYMASYLGRATSTASTSPKSSGGSGGGGGFSGGVGGGGGGGGGGSW